MEKAGLPRYEISNYAKPGFESRHNLNYWQGGAYAGIGPGAHSRLFSNNKWHAIATTKMPEDWLKAVQEKGNAIEETSPVPNSERATEIIMTAFRLKEGLDKKPLKTLTGLDFSSLVNDQSFQAMIDGLYSVVFQAADLWPEAGGRRDRVFLDLWESYLER